MIKLEQAIKIIHDVISEFNLSDEDECIIVDAETIEREWGWVFFYSSKKWLETNNLKYAMAGNTPLIVLKESGEVIITGTAHDVQYYIDRFEDMGNPHG